MVVGKEVGGRWVVVGGSVVVVHRDQGGGKGFLHLGDFVFPLLMNVEGKRRHKGLGHVR